mmetsp:Transcript_13174/g.51520  ORF Transcript_13174/g.51520 Transcript_13174/m.51520 type:complete len:538 (+) Transcript_13174:4965-6578(+)
MSRVIVIVIVQLARAEGGALSADAVGASLFLFRVELGAASLVPGLVLLVEHVELGLEPRLVVRAVAVERRVVFKFVFSSRGGFNLVVGVHRRVHPGRLGFGHGIETRLGPDFRQGEEVHLGRAGGSLLVLPVEAERGALTFLSLHLGLLLLIAPRPGVHGLLERLHLLEEFIVLVLRVVPVHVISHVIVLVIVLVAGARSDDAAAELSLQLTVETRGLAHGEPPLEQELEVHLAEDAEVLAQRANLGRRGGVRVEVHESILRGHDALLARRVEDERVVLPQQLGGLVRVHERLRRALLVEHLGAVFVAAAVALLFRAREHVDRLFGSVVVSEESSGVEQPRVDLGGRQVSDAHDVNLSRRSSRRHRLGALHLLEQLLHGIEQRVVLGGAEHLRHEPSALAEKLRGEAERVEGERRLGVGLGGEVAADVGSSVVHDDVVLGPLRGDPAKLRAARLRRDVVHEGGAPADRLDGREVDAHDERRHRHVLLRHLEPTAGGGAEVHARARAAEEVILAVELDELERRTRAEALLLGEVVELI